MKEESDTDKEFSEKVELINLWFKIIFISAITVVFLVKIIITPINLSSLDFNELLSLILAIFAIGLSVMFYFKANEISNKFYDNTYRFMQQVSIILERIEAGFGERLKHLDEGYSEFRNRFDIGQNGILGTEKSRTGKEEDKEEEKEKEKEKEKNQIIQERDQIIQNLLNNAKIATEEKDRIAEALKNKDKELQDAQNALLKLKSKIGRQLSEEAIIEKRIAVKEYFQANYQRYFTSINCKNTLLSIARSFNVLQYKFDKDWLLDCQILGLLNENFKLTSEGIIFFREAIFNKK